MTPRTLASALLFTLLATACDRQTPMAPDPALLAHGVDGGDFASITDLGTLPGAFESRANAINDLGQVVGESWPSGFVERSRPVIWRRGERIRDLGALPGSEFVDSSPPSAINDAGQIVGMSQGHAVLWQDGGIEDLGTLPDGFSGATGINDRGQVVGFGYGSVFSHAWTWRRDSGIRDLGTLPGGVVSLAAAINDAGQIVGTSDVGGFESHAVLWQRDGTIIDLGTLPGGTISSATGINNRGQVVGWSYRGGEALNQEVHGFLWHDGSMIDLGALPGGTFSSATGINDRGQVVGAANTADGTTHAFLWQAGLMRDLGTFPGGTFSEARGINNAGQVVGVGDGGPDFFAHAIVWTTRP